MPPNLSIPWGIGIFATVPGFIAGAVSNCVYASEEDQQPPKIASVSTIRFILAALLCASPAILLWDGLITQGLVAEVVAIALVITARALRPGETAFLISISRGALMLAAIPAAWMIIQSLPLGLLPHPMWKSAEAALAHPQAGAISIDPAATTIALGQYLSIVAVAFLSAAIAVDRQRAEWVFFVLIIATTAIALVTLSHNLFAKGPWLSNCAQEQAVDCSAIGVIVVSACFIRIIERYELNQDTRHSILAAPMVFVCLCAALAICAGAFLSSVTWPTLFAAAYGLAALICVTLIRRLDLGWLGISGLAISAIGIAVLLLAAHPTERGTSGSLAFAASPALRPLSQHVLDDAPLVGTGASTFLALAPTYREINDPQPHCGAATTAATIGIELGRPLLWLIALGTLVGVILLLKASLQRGRDWIYPAMGGACLLSLLLLSFTNAGVLGTATGLLIAAALGLALAQSKSRALKK